MKLENLKINFLGDSITAGTGTTDPEFVYHQVIKKDYNLKEAYNCGVGGTRIAKQSAFYFHIYDLYFALRAQIMPRDVDAVVVFGGTNDFGHGDSKMGDIDSDNIYTFCGALNNLINQLKTDFSTAKIIFLTPIRREDENKPNHDGKVLEDYVNAIIEVTKKHNVPVIDLFRSNMFEPTDSTYLVDGLHPSDAGNAVMAKYIAEELLKL